MNDAVDTLGKAYPLVDPALELGAVVLENQAFPEARVRTPRQALSQVRPVQARPRCSS
jgi:hypothetical protein